jgi:outer membrane protein assembly factor BamB
MEGTFMKVHPMLRRFLAGTALTAAALAACTLPPATWPTNRANILATGGPIIFSDPAVTDPVRVATLAVKWTFDPAEGDSAFRASPVVLDNRVFIGNGNGRMYALDATTGALLWQYPPSGQPPLSSKFQCNPSSKGIASSAVVTQIGGTDAVVFGAPDLSLPPGFGSGRLFALNAATGAEIWKSPAVAVLNGLLDNSFTGTERHEQIGYASPLVLDDRVYVGVANHCDSPIQRGRVVAVDLATGNIDPAFDYASVPAGSRGGGVWTHLAGLGNALWVTTGNSRCYWTACTEPSPNHGLSLLRVDANTGAVVWKHQPVPWALDGDPDWSAGPTGMLASCGLLIASTQKDGWSYAIDAGDGTSGPPSVRWQFPATGFPFTPADGTVHGDTRYMRPGAAWGDVFITRTGGENVTTDVSGGYGRLHALNACAAPVDRVRWIVDVPGAGPSAYSMGPPTVAGGMVYVGVQNGHLIVFGDPSLVLAAGWRCSNPDVSTAACSGAGYKLVPIPSVVADVPLGSGAILTEPVLAYGKVFVATTGGKLHMLSPVP